IDVFAPGPESLHVEASMKAGRPVIPMTPDLGGNALGLNGQWSNNANGQLSYLPTMEQLAERLSTMEENRHMRDLMTDHRDDIVLLYERLRTLVPSDTNDPVKFAWYIFWDDLYRRYARQVSQFKEHDVDFNPLYPKSLPYYPLPRHRLELFLYQRGLFKPLRMRNTARGRSPLAFFGGLFRQRKRQDEEEFDMDPMPVPHFVPGITGQPAVIGGDARIWRAGEDVEENGVSAFGASSPFEPGCPAGGFMHSGLLNRLYAWLDVICEES
ncbi:hypothetical protein IWW50_001503, partial [Coemansia erecta]